MNKKVVWITGASSGIGKALAHTYAKNNYAVVLSARQTEVLNEIKANLPSPDAHLVLPLDVTQQDTFESAVNVVKERYGRLDVLVNNAGITQRSRVMDTTLAVNRRIMEVDYFGAIGITLAVLPWFKQQGSAQIAVVTSLVGELPTPMRAGYSAAKHALHGWFEALRAEEADWLTITIVMPGFVRTNVSINALEGDGKQHGKMDNLQNSGMSPEKCAEAIYAAVSRNKAQVIIAGREKAAVYLKRWFPSLYRFVIRRVKVT